MDYSELKRLPGPPYKNANNVWLRGTLFYENWTVQRYDAVWCPVFSLYEDKPGLINARKTFVALRDITGYKWAMAYLGDWAHWLALMKHQWFRDAYEVWVAELRMLLRSEALARIEEIAQTDGQQKLPANRYLAGFEWEKNNRGRPSKEEMAGELRKQAKVLESEEDDAQRIGLVK